MYETVSNRSKSIKKFKFKKFVLIFKISIILTTYNWDYDWTDHNLSQENPNPLPSGFKAQLLGLIIITSFI